MRTGTLHPLHIVAAAIFLAVGVTSAANMVYLPIKTQAAVVDSVVRGTVLEKKTEWYGDRLSIVTTLRVQVLESLKGSAFSGSVVKIRYLGGTTADGVQLRYEGMPRVQTGEEIVFFLMDQGDGHLTPWGAQQSLLRVRTNPETGQPEIQRDMAGVMVLDEYLDGETPFQRMPLDEMKRVVNKGRLSPPTDSLWLGRN